MPLASCQVTVLRECRRGSLVGFATVKFGSGLVMHSIGVHRAGSRMWCAPPAAPMLTSGVPVTDPATGRPRYLPLVTFSSHGVRASWSRQILRALEAAHPELFTDAEIAGAGAA